MSLKIDIHNVFLFPNTLKYNRLWLYTTTELRLHLNSMYEIYIICFIVMSY